MVAILSICFPDMLGPLFAMVACSVSVFPLQSTDIRIMSGPPHSPS